MYDDFYKEYEVKLSDGGYIVFNSYFFGAGTWKEPPIWLKQNIGRHGVRWSYDCSTKSLWFKEDTDAMAFKIMYSEYCK